MRLHLDVFGDSQLDRELLRFQDRFSDLTPAFEVLADDFLDVNTRQFASEGGNSGHWAELAPSTVRQRGSAHPILDEHGDLRRSLTTKDGAKGAIREIGPHEMFVGTDIDYARFHQTGTGARAGGAEGPLLEGEHGMPRRRPVELTRTDRERWVKSLQRFVTTGEPGIGL